MGCVSNTESAYRQQSYGGRYYQARFTDEDPEAHIELVCPDYLVLENVLQAIVCRAPPKQKG